MSTFASGSAIRSACISPNIDQLQKYMPEDSFYLLEDCLKKGNYVKNISISSTMGPGIKLDLNSFDK